MIYKNELCRSAVFALVATGTLALGLASAAGLNRDDVKKVQQSLIDKGYQAGSVDGVLGPRTRAGLRQYQKSESLPVTGRLDNETAGKLGVGPESIGGNFKGAGSEVSEGSQEAGSEIKDGQPLAAGKEFGKGIGRAAEKIGSGIRKAVTLDSDRADREKNEKKKQ